jgi:CheY-like chemotaxis protein
MSEILRVLLVEDSEDDAMLILRELRREGREVVFKRVETRQDMTAALEQDEWDIILSDYAMPKFSGLDALEVFKEKGLDDKKFSGTSGPGSRTRIARRRDTTPAPSGRR